MQVTDRVLLIGLDESDVGNLRKAVEEVVASTAGEPIQESWPAFLSDVSCLVGWPLPQCDIHDIESTFMLSLKRTS